MKRNFLLAVTGITFLFVLSSCAYIGVQRIATDTSVDLSGKWNDTDSGLVAKEMIEDVLGAGWLKKYLREHGRAPVAVVGKIRNRSDEHINTGPFIKDLETALVNSGEVEFVASKTERDELREERAEQAAYASEETAKSQGEETGADFMLKGSINTITDKIEGKSVKYYQVNLELIGIETNKKVWIGEKKIKKIVKQSRFGF